MTHTKFIELLNLYLDHEISMEDAAALEAEIQRNPQRMAIYRQYCQMHRGCTQLAHEFSAAPAFGTRKLDVQAPAPRHALRGWMYGTAAAAACAVFALVLLIRQGEPGTAGTIASTRPTKTEALAHGAPPASAPAIYSFGDLVKSRPELHAVYNSTLANFKVADMGKAGFYASPAGARFDWMDEVKLTPVENDEFTFRVRPAVADGVRTYRSQRPIEGKVEMTAFQFQR